MLQPYHGTQNLHGRDDKLHPTFKSRMEEHRFSIPILMTWCYEIVSNCKDLHVHFQKFLGMTLPDPHPINGVGAFFTLACIHCPTFSELQWLVILGRYQKICYCSLFVLFVFFRLFSKNSIVRVTSANCVYFLRMLSPVGINTQLFCDNLLQFIFAFYSSTSLVYVLP